MRYTVFLLIGVLVFGVLMQVSSMLAYAQETPQYFQQIEKTKDNCPVTHLFATKMIVPIMIKEFHDPTPNWQVTSVSLTNSTNSLVTLDGNDNYTFLISSKSIDQFNFRTVASYTDTAEHPIYVEYWTQNQLVGRDGFTTTNGYFCHDFLVDTANAPPTLDYNKMLQDAQAGAFQGLISAVLEDHGSLESLVIVILVATGVNFFILIIFLIFNRSSGSTSKKVINKVKLAVEKLQSNIAEINMLTQHVILAEKQSSDRDKKRDDRLNNALHLISKYVQNYQDQFVIAFRTMMQDTSMINQNKLDNFEKLVKIEPLRFEEVKPVTNDVDVTEIEKEIEKVEPIVVEKKPTIKERILHKVRKKEVVIKTQEEWRQFFMDKKLTKEQVLKLYNNMSPYIQKNYMNDIDGYNKYNALFNLYQELDK